MIDFFKNLDVKIQAALISALVTIFTLIISLFAKNFLEKKIHSKKLKLNYEYEQRSKLKNLLSEHKMDLLRCCESLNHRYHNLMENHKCNWLSVNVEKNKLDDKYYILSYVYRLLALFANINLLEKKMIFLDTTISTKEDLYFIKFLKVFYLPFCNITPLTNGFTVDKDKKTDHFYINEFNEMSNYLIENEIIIGYKRFEEKLKEDNIEIMPIIKFLDGISPDEERLRWDRLQLFHLSIIGFTNYFGYDYQKHKTERLKDYYKLARPNKLVSNYGKIIETYKLGSIRVMKRILKSMKK